jgi:hypothetical protein
MYPINITSLWLLNASSHRREHPQLAEIAQIKSNSAAILRLHESESSHRFATSICWMWKKERKPKKLADNFRRIYERKERIWHSRQKKRKKKEIKKYEGKVMGKKRRLIV